MKFHTGVPMSAPKYDPEAISALARKADEVGYHYIGGAERLIMPRVIHSKYPRGTGEIPGVGSGQNMLEAQSTMSFIAGQTKQIRLMPFFVVPYRNPILAAKMLATIDVLSNGRMNILIGPGWNREEAAAMLMPTPWEKRGAVTNEYLQAFTELWSKENPTFHGEYLDISEVDFAPKTVQQPHIPYWIGGESPPALRRAALLGDGWAPAGNNQAHPIETLAPWTRSSAAERPRAAICLASVCVGEAFPGTAATRTPERERTASRLPVQPSRSPRTSAGRRSLASPT